MRSPALALSLSLVCALAQAEPTPSSTAAPTFTDAERQQLNDGKVIIHRVTPTDDRGVGVESFGIIDAPSTEVWPVVRDCEHFHAFMPRTKSSGVTVEAGENVCHVELALPFPLPNLWSDTKSDLTESPAGHFLRRWRMVRGTYRRNSGAFLVIPWGEGKTLLGYFIDSDPKLAVPDAILNSAQTGSLPDLFVAVRNRVMTLRSTK